MNAHVSVAAALTALGLFAATPALASAFADANFGGVVSSHQKGATSATAESSLADTWGLAYDCRCGGFSSSSASLVDGALQQHVEGGGAYKYSGAAASGFSDVLRFVAAGATDTTLTTIDFILSGAMHYVASGNGLVGATLAVNAAISGAGINPTVYASTIGGNLFVLSPMDAIGSQAFEKIFTLQFYGKEATVNVDFSQQLSLLVPDDASGSLTALSHLAVVAPSTVSYSGLGGRIASPVPEPAAWMLAILGFGLVGAAMRRRRGQVVRAAA